MADEWRWLRPAAMNALEAIATLPVLIALHVAGLAGHAPLWALVALFVLGGSPNSQRYSAACWATT